MHLRTLFSDEPRNTRPRILLLYALLLAFNAAAWLWALLAFRNFPLLLGTAFLAYSFGLRHAVDADHIAAIDNVTRKLMQSGKRPIATGFFFSLGHSTVVVLGSIAIAAGTLTLQHRLAPLRHAGALIGTLVSTLFLFAIAIVNVFILRTVYQAFQRVRHGLPHVEEDFNFGILTRLFRPAFSLITRSWHMYPLGFLFGLGFDTATEIGLLALSAAEASRGLPLTSILIFPTLFTAAMALVDTTDNILMIGAYGWAFVHPIRKLYYNLTITSISVLVAFAVGGLEALGLLAPRMNPTPFWLFITRLDDHFGLIGYAVIALFAISWLISIAIYKWHHFDHLETTL